MTKQDHAIELDQSVHVAMLTSYLLPQSACLHFPFSNPSVSSEKVQYQISHTQPNCSKVNQESKRDDRIKKISAN